MAYASQAGRAKQKRCNGCQEDLPSSSFSILKPGSGDRNNLAPRCKKCRAAKNAAWNRANRERMRSNCKRWYLENLEHVRAYSAKQIAENREERLAANKVWKKAHAARNAFNANKKRMKTLCATPKWLTSDHWDQIQAFYDEAKRLTAETGVRHHVDHIHPIQGENFSGLNVPWNLQVLTASANISKKNRIPQDEAHLFLQAA